MLHFNILGSLHLQTCGGTVQLTSPRVKSVLATLLLAGGQPVNKQAIIDEVWPVRPPRSAVGTIQTYICQLRKLLSGIAGPEAEQLLVTDGHSYQLAIEEQQLDYGRFMTLYEQGGNLLRADRPDEASAALSEALSLWRGQPLADLEMGPRLAAEVIRMEAQRDGARRLRIEADLRTGRHIELIPELEFLVRTEPLHEWVHAYLLSALSRAGRRADALRVYQDIRRLLRDELGLGPSKELEQLHLQVLTGEPV